MQEGFAEVKLKDLSNQYDFISLRVGVQSFTSDFRGFIFSDQEPGVRLFGNLDSNRYQFNLAYFAMLEKDTNSGLNTFAYRHQQVMIANIYRQDFIKPGYTLFRPASTTTKTIHPSSTTPTISWCAPLPIGLVTPHSIRAYYYGLTGDGPLRQTESPRMPSTRFWARTNSMRSPDAAGEYQCADGAPELSLDKDWIRYRLSFFYASGDKDPRDGSARFDTIFDNPNFAGGFFSLWERGRDTADQHRRRIGEPR